MTVDMYGFSQATNQGNMINSAVSERNRNITLRNNDIDNKIAQAKTATTEEESVTGGVNVLKESLAGSNLASTAKNYINSAQDAAKTAKQTLSTAQTVAAQGDKALSAGKSLGAKGTSKIANAVDTTADIASSKAGAVVEDGIKGALGVGESVANKVLKVGGVINDTVTIGTDLEADLTGQFSKMDWEQKVGNIGGIAGSALDIVGTAFPPLALLSVVGTGISALTGAIGAIGDTEAEKKAGDSQVSQLQGQKQVLTQVQSNAGKVPISVQ